MWLTDLTYIATDEGWLYLCSILDVFSRRLLGWSLADHMRTELCPDALDAAAMVRAKLASPARCCIRTTAVNTRATTSKPLRKLGIVQSMGTVGDSMTIA